MFETKKDYNENEMRTLNELLYGTRAIKEQALSSKIFLWEGLVCSLTCRNLLGGGGLSEERDLTSVSNNVLGQTFY